MYRLNFYTKPSDLNKVNYGMIENTEFVITGSGLNYHSELQNCIIGLRPPYAVAKIHAFRTRAKNAELSERQEGERRDYLSGLAVRQQNAEKARAMGVTVHELMGQMGVVYDEELDEMRLVAKVPGLNIYLELLGVMEEEDTATERAWKDSRDGQPFDRAIDAQVAWQLQRMSYFMTTAHEERDRRSFATKMSDWQPRLDWVEEYDPEEFWKRPERKGIGFTFVDPARRGPVHVKHFMTAEEKAEFARLKAEVEASGKTLTADDIRKMKLQAVANVAEQKYLNK